MESAWVFSIGLLSFIINISCTKHSSFPRHFLRTYNFRQGSWGRNAGQTSAWKASVKRANFSRQTVALPPLCFCTCNQDVFCTKKLFSAVCEAFSLVQVKVCFVFILFDRTDFPCLCSALVCEWRSTTVCLYLKGNCCNEIY